MKKRKKAKPIIHKPSVKYTVIVVALALIFYANSIMNEYAFDDYIYVKGNSLIEKGLAGIPDLMTTDALYSLVKSKGASSVELSGGRYRPLSLVTFAIEYQVFKGNPFVSHGINVLLYMLTAFFLFRLLAGHIFKGKQLLSFVACALFIMHPLHTEVVANIKGRDEIMSLLFIILSLEYFFRFSISKIAKERWLSLLFLFLALLSKEYALSFFLLIPVVHYVFMNYDVKENIRKSIPYWIVIFFYLILRISLVGFSTEQSGLITNNPYLLASGMEAFATKLYVLGYYIKLLFIPFPLACDYSFNTIPYQDLLSLPVILSAVVYGGMVFMSFRWLRQKNKAVLGLLLFLFPLFFVSNLVMEIGAPMGERLVYHSSLGFAMLLSLALLYIIERFVSNKNQHQIAALSIVGLLAIVSFMIVFQRNNDWKNSYTLFSQDIKTVPNNISLISGLASEIGNQMQREADPTKKEALANVAIGHLENGIAIRPQWENLPLNLGYIYYLKDDYESANKTWTKALSDFPTSRSAKNFLRQFRDTYLNKAMQKGSSGDSNQARYFIKKALDLNPLDDELWYHLGGTEYMLKNYTASKQAWERALELNPSNQKAKEGLNSFK